MIGRSAHVPGPSDDCETPHVPDDSDVRATEPWLLVATETPGPVSSQAHGR